jgi:hypothetical protein
MVPTAEEILHKHVDVQYCISRNGEEQTYKAMIEFTKLHVEAALKAASENASAYTEKDSKGGTWNLVDKDSILNSYPLENIK